MKRYSRILFLVLAAMLGSVAAADTFGRQTVDVVLDQRSDVDRLEALGLIVDSVSGNVARAYADEAGLEALNAGNWRYSPAPPELLRADFSAYHDYESLTTELQAYATAHPDIARLYSVGTSIDGRELWVMLISDNPDLEEDEPEFKYVSTIHGDEPLGTELCLRLIDYLLEGYGTNERTTTLINETAITILPLMNPDGREAGMRWNANGLDMNRSFPHYPTDFQATYFDGGAISIEGREPEVAAVMNWSMNNSFALSANIHTGSLVVNYPYDAGEVPSGVAAISPDESLFQFLSLQYSQENPPLYASDEFPQGISNGSAWYRIEGGMQDWNYRYLGCMEVTLELSNVKWPASAQLAGFWENNRESMLAYMESVHLGIRGVATSHQTGEPVACKVLVDGNAQPVFSDPEVGDFHRILLPGTHSLTITAVGFIPFHVPEVVVNEGAATRVTAGLSNGDVVVDGAVNALDLQRVLQGILEAERDTVADVDGGGVTVTDLQLVLNRALARQPAAALKAALPEIGGTFPAR